MPGFFERLRRPFLRQSHHQDTNTNILPISEDKGKQRADNHDETGYTQWPSRSSSPLPLPEITDSGPPTAHKYENEDIFWNSSMTEADYDPQKAPGKWNNKDQHIRHQDDVNAMEAEPWRHVRAPRLPTIKEEVHHPSPGTTTRRQQRRQESSNDKSQDLGTTTNHRTDNDLIVMLAYPSLPPSPLRDPILPGTEEWDAFMDFPSANSMHIYRDADGNRHVVFPVRPAIEFTTTAALTVPHEGPPPAESHRQLSLSPPLAAPPDHQHSDTSPDSPVGEVLTWNVALNRILENEHVDPSMKRAVKERVQSSHTTNGIGDTDHSFVSAVEAGLVPNFSYPIAGSAFYDRIAAERVYQQSMNNGSEDGQYKESKDDEVEEELPNGVSSYTVHSSCSSESDHEELYRAPTHLDESSDRVFFLLSSLLTPSELSLHHHILDVVPSTHSPPFPATTPVSNASSATPRIERLVCKLQKAILGLQDRVDGLEDVLVPQLAKWLEQKSEAIDELSLETLNLRAETVGLKRAIDFGNRTLGGCWEREGELWRTLAELQAKRKRKGRLFRRLMTRGSRDPQDGGLSNANIPDGFEQQIFSNNADHSGPSGMSQHIQRNAMEQQPTSNPPMSRTTRSNMVLSNREVDALLAIAAQNVRILKEDMQDMVTLVQECKGRAEGPRETERVEGSWRDV